jgi:hypothetical protein
MIASADRLEGLPWNAPRRARRKSFVGGLLLLAGVLALPVTAGPQPDIAYEVTLRHDVGSPVVAYDIPPGCTLLDAGQGMPREVDCPAPSSASGYQAWNCYVLATYLGDGYTTRRAASQCTNADTFCDYELPGCPTAAVCNPEAISAPTGYCQETGSPLPSPPRFRCTVVIGYPTVPDLATSGEWTVRCRLQAWPA